MLALVSSGRSLCAYFLTDEVDSRNRLHHRPARSHRAALRRSFSNAVPRTVMTFLSSEDRTVAIALPA